MASSLTKVQRAFLKGVRDEGLLLPEILKRTKVKPELLMRWFRRNYFRKALREARGDLRQRMWLDIELMANAAVEYLRRTFRSKRRGSAQMIELCRMMIEERDRAWKRTHRGKPGRRIIEEPEDLCHPDFKHQEKELDAILDGKVDHGNN